MGSRLLTKLAVLAVVFALISAQAFAAVHYITQSGAGTQDGSSAANARSLSWVNDSGNWSGTVATANKVSPADSVLFSGTITSTFTVQGSGTSGNPITIGFADASSKFSAPTWGASSSCAIYASAKSYITVDGGSSSIVRVEATDSGELLTNKVVGASGIRFDNGGTNQTIRNMWVNDLYVRVPGSIDYVQSGYGIVVESDGDSVIEFCRVEEGETGIYMKGNGIGITGLWVRDCTIQNCSNGIKFGPKSTNGTTIGGGIIRNRIDGLAVWGDSGNAPDGVSYFHNDGIQTISSQSGNLITGLVVGWNHIGPDFGTDGRTTCAIFMEDKVKGCHVINNFIESSSGHWCSNGYILNGYGYWETGDPFGTVANNTIVSDNGKLLVAGNCHVVGNILVGEPNATYLHIDTAQDRYADGMVVDCNVYRNSTGQSFHEFFTGLTYNSLTSWRAARPHDDNTVTTDPLLNADGSLQAGSSAIDLMAPLSQTIKDYLTDIYTSDYNQATRTGDWDAGAFEYGASAPGGGQKRAKVGGKDIRIGGKVIKIGDN